MRQIQKRAAIEMSITTIVTIVLAISFLVVGIFLIQRISKSATSVVDLTDQQMREQINKLFSEASKLVICPQTDTIVIKQEAVGGVGIGIKNLLSGSAGTTTFSYTVTATDVANCGVTEAEAEDWIVTGKSDTGIAIASGDLYSTKILFKIPTGAPLCVAKFRVNVNAGSAAYSTASFNIEIQAK
jgi:uncharacterized protein YoxC